MIGFGKAFVVRSQEFGVRSKVWRLGEKMLNFVEVSRAKLLNNIEAVRRKLSSGTKIMAVVKANAYGHGLVEVAKIFEPEVDWLAVVEISEAITLRESGIKTPILVLGYIEEEKYNELFRQNITPSIYSFEVLEKISEAAKKTGRKIDVHVKIDTGMNRMGFRFDEIGRVIEEMKKSQLMWQGIYSHFYNENNREVCMDQLGLMKKVIDMVEKSEISVELKHMAKSQLTVELPESHFNMVRVGGILYGLSRYSDEFLPAGEFKARVGLVKMVKKGMAVGYDGCYMAPKDMKVAVVTAGYADGFRSFGPNTGFVLIGGKRCLVVGRICMNQAMVDVNDENIQVGDEVVMVGSQGGEIIKPWDYADETKCVTYETMARIPDHVARVFID